MVLEAVDFRKKASASKRDEAQVEAQVLRMLEGYLQVEELLGLPSVEWDKPRDVRYPVVNDLGEADRGLVPCATIGDSASSRSPTWWRCWKGAE